MRRRWLLAGNDRISTRYSPAADDNAQTVVVRGKVNGNISAKEKIEIKTKAELFGDIRASKLSVEEGVTFVGKTEVNPNKISPTPSARPGEAPKAPEPGKPPGR